MAEERNLDLDALPKALQPFASSLAIIDALPGELIPSDKTPLRENLAGKWPTLADLRALVEWGSSVATRKAKEGNG